MDGKDDEDSQCRSASGRSIVYVTDMAHERDDIEATPCLIDVAGACRAPLLARHSELVVYTRPPISSNTARALRTELDLHAQKIEQERRATITSQHP